MLSPCLQRFFCRETNARRRCVSLADRNGAVALASESAALRFLRSHESIGIQIADILAGFCTRYVQDAVWGGASRQDDRAVAFNRLVNSANRNRGTGNNFVAPAHMLHFLGIAPIPNY